MGLLRAAALCSLLGSASVSRLPQSGVCFGGASHGAADNTARYGHAAGAAGCGGAELMTEQSGDDGGAELTSGVLELTSRGKGGATQQLRWLGNETALIIIDMWHYHPCKTVRPNPCPLRSLSSSGLASAAISPAGTLSGLYQLRLSGARAQVTNRAGALVPRINAVTAALRQD